MNINIFGFHSVFYYYGFQHLVVNMYKYINDGINNKEFTCLCSDDQLYIELKKALNDKCENMDLLSTDDLCKIHKDEGLKGVKKIIHNYTEEIIKKGYSGLRIIIKCDYIIEKFSSDNFLNIEKEINDLIKDTNVSILCVYDFEDYLKDKKIMTDKIINSSYINHQHRLYNMKLVNSSECFK